jgi:urease alpha subunit
MVDNSATGSTVSFIRSGQVTAVSIAVGEKAFVYYNGTDYVKVASSAVSGITGPANGGTGIANNAASTVTISGNFATTLTLTGTTSVTMPTSGTIATKGNAIAFSIVFGL